MAQVYRAHDLLLDRPVALKVLFPELSVDRSFVERFRREAQAAANLSHPNIVPVFDWGEDGGTYFIVMEFIDGRTLSSILQTAGPAARPTGRPRSGPTWPPPWPTPTATASSTATSSRATSSSPTTGQVKVTDFGIARAINTEESLTQTGAVMGTATYFSPEQAQGIGVDARSDIYSLGVVLYEMVTGRPPFLGDTPVAVAYKHVREHPPAPREINPAVPPDLEAIILKAWPRTRPTATHRRRPAGRPAALQRGPAVLAMDDATAVLAAAGATQAVGAFGGTDVTQAVSATADRPDGRRRPRTAVPTGPAPTPSSWSSCWCSGRWSAFFLGRNLGVSRRGAPSFTCPT